MKESLSMWWMRVLLLMFSLTAISPQLEAQGIPPPLRTGATDPPDRAKMPDTRTPEPTGTPDPQEEPASGQNLLGVPILKRIALDQKAIWTSPRRMRLEDASWMVPLGGITAGLLATDTATSRHLSNSPNRLNRSRNLSDVGVAALVGAAGGLYFWGKLAGDEHKRETGLLAGEALINSLAVNSAIQFATGRERPVAESGQGSFWRGGHSFPSNHAAAAWSVASVIAHEYPGPLTKLLAYGLASTVSAARVTGKQHFPSDVMIGSAIGWFVGRQVYRAHHDSLLGGSSWDSIPGALDPELQSEPRNMGSPFVPLDSWVYPAIERLAALGFVRTAMFGMRPWTRLECARLVDEASDRLRDDKFVLPEVERTYHALEEEFTGDLELFGGVSNRRMRLESVYTRFTGISGKPLTDGYHFGQTILNEYGRPYQEGFNSVSGFSGWAEAGPFAIYLRGEYEHAPSAPALPDSVRQLIPKLDFRSDLLPSQFPVMPPTPFAAVNQFRLLDAYVAVNLENWQISFGKQSLWWGPSAGGPLMFSNDAEPIDMLRISRVVPFKLPSIFGLLGPMRTEFFVGQLAGHQFVFGPTGLIGQFGRSLNPQPFIHGQKITFKPTPNFEFGVSRTTIFAGPGVPFNAHTLFNSLFSGRNGPPGTSTDPGDRRSGADFSYRVPKLRDWLTFYGEAVTDDEISPLGYPRRSAMVGGIYLPRLPKLARMDLRAEGGYTNIPGDVDVPGFFYFNSRFINGYTNGGFLVGSWIGRQGDGEQAWTTYWLSPQSTIQLGYRHQTVSAQFIPGGGTVNDANARANLWLRPDLSLTISVQYEQWKFPVMTSGAQMNVSTSMGLTFWPWRKHQ